MGRRDDSMHELSIANSLVEIATEHATEAGAQKVNSITLRIGALSCVHRNALEFSFELVTMDTLLEGATLKIIDVPVRVFCIPCDHEVQLPGIQSFRCPACNTPSADIRQGKELDIDSIEIVEKTTLELNR
jgi:hydrogenase nickel incorporation protein HypA/HybF